METMVNARSTLHYMLRTAGADDVSVSDNEDEQPTSFPVRVEIVL